MAEFEVTAPDGRTFIITAPEGASQDEVLNYAKKNMPAASAPAAQQQPNGVMGKLAQVPAGFNERALDIAGSIMDAAGYPLRAGGRALGVPEQYLPQAGGARPLMAQGLEAIIGKAPAAQTQGEQVLRGIGGGIADAASIALPAAGVANAARAGSMTAKAAGALAENPVTQLLSGAAAGGVQAGTDNPLLGLAAGMAVPALAPAAGAVAGRVWSPVRPSTDPKMRDALAFAEQEGIAQHLTPGQMSGNQTLRRAETMMRAIPGNGPAARNEGLQEAYNAAAMRRAGITGETKLSPQVLGDQQQVLGQRIADIYDRNTLNLNPNSPEGAQNLQGLAAPLQDARRVGVQGTSRELMRQYDDLLSKLNSNGTVEGGAVRQLRTSLREQAKALEGSNGDLSRYMLQMRDALTSAMDNSISVVDKGDLKEANRLYANLKTLQGAMDSPTAAAAGDDLSPSALGRSLKASMGKGSMAAGRGDLHELVDMGKLLVEPSIKDSGTAQNTLAMRAITGAGAAASGLGAMDPATAMLAAAATYGPTGAYRLGMSTGYLNPRKVPDALEAALPRISPADYAAILAARGRVVPQKEEERNGPLTPRALAAALLGQ